VNETEETEDSPTVVGLVHGRPEDALAIARWAGEMIASGFEISVRRLEDGSVEGIAF
jgi:hypothetical protein